MVVSADGILVTESGLFLSVGYLVLRLLLHLFGALKAGAVAGARGERMVGVGGHTLSMT